MTISGSNAPVGFTEVISSEARPSFLLLILVEISNALAEFSTVAVGVLQPRMPKSRIAMKQMDFFALIGCLTNEAKRPRLHRDDERSRDSEMLRENGRQCRRGPS